MPHYRAEILTTFGSYFGRNDDFINSFLNLLTFSAVTRPSISNKKKCNSLGRKLLRRNFPIVAQILGGTFAPQISKDLIQIHQTFAQTLVFTISNQKIAFIGILLRHVSQISNEKRSQNFGRKMKISALVLKSDNESWYLCQ